MKPVMRKLMLGSSLSAIGAVSIFGIFPAMAQSTPGNASNVESVVSTGTRLTIGGYEAPTPVTVIGIEQIQREAKMNLIDQSLACRLLVSRLRPIIAETLGISAKAMPP